MKSLSKYAFAALLPLLAATSTLAGTSDSAADTITPSTLGKVIWADLYTGDVAASIDFYSKTFGWTVKKFGQEKASYHLFFDNEQPIAGLLARSAKRNKTEQALWIGNIASDNVQQQVTQAANNKASIILAPHDFALYGQRAVIADPQGGIVALLNLEDSNKKHQNLSDKWSWSQLFSTNTKNASDFYQASFSYQAQAVANMPNSYYLAQQDEILASIVNLPKSFEQRDRWVNFISVNNLNTVLSKAKQNGAEVIYQPKDNQLAIIADPNGAFLGLLAEEQE